MREFPTYEKKYWLKLRELWPPTQAKDLSNKQDPRLQPPPDFWYNQELGTFQKVIYPILRLSLLSSGDAFLSRFIVVGAQKTILRHLTFS